MEKELKEEMLNDYRNLVLECLYYANTSWLKEEEIDEIKKEYKLDFIDSLDDIIEQFTKYNTKDLTKILNLLDIEPDSEWTSANRCESGALLLWRYLDN
jgi:hypothetical protein